MLGQLLLLWLLLLLLWLLLWQLLLLLLQLRSVVLYYLSQASFGNMIHNLHY